MIDLRSDTVTKPTPGMLSAMMSAEVGDDVYNEDPTVNRLQERVADLLGKEAGLYVPSGTMANQIALKLHTRPGDEVLCEATNHIHLWEAGAPAILSGITLRLLPGKRGVLDLDDFANVLKPENIHQPRTRLVALENTHNRGGGTIFPLANIERITNWARQHQLANHLDGARLFNASVATGISMAEWAKHFDTVSVCFSKGLGTPIGSVLVGSKEMMREALRVRKWLGGAMRQVGILAAACLYALDHHVERLADDHAHAKLLSDQIATLPGLSVDPTTVETNLVWIEVDPRLGSASQVSAKLRAEGVLISALDGQLMRACTHLDVSRDQIIRTIEIIKKVVATS